MRIVYFGGGKQLSSYVLAELLRRDMDVRAVLLSGYGPANAEPGPKVRESVAPSVVALARHYDIAVEFVPPNSGSQATLDVLRRHAADIGLSVCHPRRIPLAVCAAMRVDLLNLHPSLLPAYRGPAPLFWQLRGGEQHIGVTLHRLTETLDAGPVLAQRAVTLSDGARADEIDRVMAAHGAAMFTAALRCCHDDSLIPRAQDESRASYYPAPGEHDRVVPVTWSARRAFNFLRGVHDGYPQIIDTGQVRVAVRSAVAFTPHQTDDGSLRREGDAVWIRFDPGAVLVRYSGSFDTGRE